VADFIALSAIVIVAFLPLLQRLYIQRFWIRGRGTVVRLEGGMNTNSDAGSGWVWTPVIEYYVAGQRFSSQFSYWQRINGKSKYSVGDEVGILYSPRNPSRFLLDSWDSWINYIAITIFILFAFAVASRSFGH